GLDSTGRGSAQRAGAPPAGAAVAAAASTAASAMDFVKGGRLYEGQAPVPGCRSSAPPSRHSGVEYSASPVGLTDSYQCAAYTAIAWAAPPPTPRASAVASISWIAWQSVVASSRSPERWTASCASVHTA